MRVAIIGSGVSGLVTAHLLGPAHDVTVFEANDYVGGHVHTHSVRQDGESFAVDSGFIVFNEKNYPNFTQLLARLRVASQPAPMSFSVKCDRTGLEYNGTSLRTLFCQKRNLVRPYFWRMIRDIVRFNRVSPEILKNGSGEKPLIDYLSSQRFSEGFIDHYILPMASALWSAPLQQVRDFPAAYFVRWFDQHGMLQVNDRPHWRVIQGGSRRYVDRLLEEFPGEVRTRTPVRSIRREPDGVRVTLLDGSRHDFDKVVLATHSDQSLRMLEDPSPEESEILGSIPYQENSAVLHTDESVLPRRRRAWAAWNYHVPKTERARVSVTYNMNELQTLSSRRPFCVTLNDERDVADERALRRMSYEHPVYTVPGVAAQKRHDEINGRRSTYYCGAYWGAGFHEDGVRSALAVGRRFGRSL